MVVVIGRENLDKASARILYAEIRIQEAAALWPKSMEDFWRNPVESVPGSRGKD